MQFGVKNLEIKSLKSPKLVPQTFRGGKKQNKTEAPFSQMFLRLDVI